MKHYYPITEILHWESTALLILVFIYFSAARSSSLSKETALNSLNYYVPVRISLADRFNDCLTDTDMKVLQSSSYSTLSWKNACPPIWVAYRVFKCRTESELLHQVRRSVLGGFIVITLTHTYSTVCVLRTSKHRKESWFQFPHSFSAAAVFMGAQKIFSVPKNGEND